MRAWLILVMIYLLAPAVKARTSPSALPDTTYSITVIAHRGNHVNVPENTLEAYEAAIACGADYIETDLRTTKDGHLVVMHDETIEKMTGESGKIEEMTLAELRTKKIKPVLQGDTSTYRIPDFASILKLCKGKISIYLDFKEADAAETYRMIREAGMEDHIVVYLNKEEQYTEWQKTAPQIPLMASIPEDLSVEEAEVWVSQYRLSVIDNAYSREMTEMLNARGIATWLDVQGSGEGPERWEKALKVKPGGLQTGQPEKLIEYLRENKLY